MNSWDAPADPTQRLSVAVSERPRRAVACTLRGELDMHTRPVADAVIGPELSRAPGMLLLDLAEVRFCDSAGLNMLLTLRNRALDLAVPLVLVAPSARVVRLLQVTETLALFEVHPHTAAAMDRFEADSGDAGPPPAPWRPRPGDS